MNKLFMLFLPLIFANVFGHLHLRWRFFFFVWWFFLGGGCILHAQNHKQGFWDKYTRALANLHGCHFALISSNQLYSIHCHQALKINNTTKGLFFAFNKKFPIFYLHGPHDSCHGTFSYFSDRAGSCFCRKDPKNCIW